ncbi:hypothetical protein ACJRO7_013575 [Eucalyptus globulus]|uniref:Uncharacterized protein n=1 Tax=Eucalyptus globulus TaxID=34317 RepID=A0ABD3KY29_EUCGL
MAAAAASGWTSANALAVGLCLVSLAWTGFSHRLDLLPPSALATQRLSGVQNCFRATKTLRNCGTALSRALLPLLPKAHLQGGVLEPEEPFLSATLAPESVLGVVLDILSKAKSASAACCRSINRIIKKCGPYGLLERHVAFQVVSATCKGYGH